MTISSIPSFHRRKRPSRSAGIRMHGRRTNTRTLVAQILRTMKCQPNCLAAINARSRAIAHHANGNVAHDEVRRLAPRGLKETKDWNAMVRGLVWHLSPHEEVVGYRPA